MTEHPPEKRHDHGRRTFIWTGLGLAAAGAGYGIYRWLSPRARTRTFIGKAADYQVDFGRLISTGLKELGLKKAEVKGKRILLKPNLVEALPGIQVTTNPAVVIGAAEAFRRLGAGEVVVAEGSANTTDTFRLLDLAGYSTDLPGAKLKFVDLNYDDVKAVSNAGGRTGLRHLMLPRTVLEADWIVSMPKMKTHHWAGVSLAMKNLLGTMPGSFYGWPKNVIHQVGIQKTILDINSTVRSHFSIVDGVVGMDGDGPIMGRPRPAGVIVMGRLPASVDATCCRVMEIDPERVGYLSASRGRFGPINIGRIVQRGETIDAVKTRFTLLDYIPVQRALRG